MKTSLVKLFCILMLVMLFTGCAETKTVASSEDTQEVMIQITEATEINTEAEELILFRDREEPEETEEMEGPYLLRVHRDLGYVEVFSLKDGNGILFKTMLCSVGIGGTSEEDSCTPLGRFEISDRYEWRPLFGNVQGQYAVRFNGHILFHSVPYLKADKGTLKPDEYNKLGEPASMGCVRLCVTDAKWIYDNCPNGTVVEVVDEYCVQTNKPLGIKVSSDSRYAGWDPTDPDLDNPWIGKLPTIKNVKDIVVVKGQSKDVLKSVYSEVYGRDYDGEELNVFISNIDDIDLNTYGTYEIIYETTGSYGATVYESANVEVVDEIWFYNNYHVLP